MMKLGVMLAEYRVKKKIKQDVLAAEIGIPAPRLSQIESGRQTGLSLQTALKLMEWLLK